MSDKDNTSLYLTTELVERAEDIDEWESVSNLVDALLRAYMDGDIDLSLDGISDSNTVSNTHVSDRLVQLEARMDEFEDEGMPTMHKNTRGRQELRAEVESMKDRIDRLENIAGN